MVLTDISQLSAECSDWRQILKNYKDEFVDCKSALQEICRKSLSRENLQEIEHFENQFQIQLLNIHDLKHRIKFHEKEIENGSSSENVTDDVYSRHEQLLDQFLSLENTMQELRIDFKGFISSTNC